MNDFAVVAAEHLKLDVPRLFDVALEEQAVVSKRFHRLAPRRFDRRLQFAAVADDLHSFSAASR